MSIVWMVGKIAGIALLVILGILLLLICLILFVPIRYHLTGEAWQEDTTKFRVQARATWLLHLVSFRVSYEERLCYLLRVIGIPLLDSEREKQEKPRKKQRDRAEEKAEEEQEEDSEEYLDKDLEENIEETEIQELESKSVQEQKPNRNESSECGTGSELVSGPEDSSTASSGILDKISGAIRAFFARIRRILTAIASIPAKIAELLQKKDHITHLLQDERNKKAFRLIWAELCYLLTHFKFRRTKIDLIFSTGDPATTGQLLGGLSMLPFVYQKGVHISPDFEADAPYATGTFSITGRARLIHVLCSFIRLITKREIRRLIKLLSHGN